MSSWLPIAIGGHLLNALAFLIDKALLTTAFRKSGTYAALIGGLSCIVLIAIPWANVPPASDWPALAGFGSLFVFALWLFFEALRVGEATRVVPIIGSLIPIFTLIDTSVLVGEHLSTMALWGFGLLVVATFILASGGDKGRLDRRTIVICVLSALLFAASSSLGKYAFLHGDFFGVFVWSRLFAALSAMLIILCAKGVAEELAGSGEKKKQSAQSLVLLVVGQVSGAFGFFFIQYAISMGSAAIVNALQSVQYVALVLVAWFGGKHLQDLLAEHRTSKSLMIKGAAIVCVAVGLYLITHGSA